MHLTVPRNGYINEFSALEIAELAKINKNSKLVRIYVFNALETGQVSNVDKILRECPELAIPVFKMIGSEQMSNLLQSSEISRKGPTRFGLDRDLLNASLFDIEQNQKTEQLVKKSREKIKKQALIDFHKQECSEVTVHKVKEPVDSRNTINFAVMQNLT